MLIDITRCGVCHPDVCTDGNFVSVGMLEPIADGGLDYGQVSMRRITSSGSLIGNLAETQEVFDFSAEHGISAEVRVIPATKINDAFDEIVSKDVCFRDVVDTSTLRDWIAPITHGGQVERAPDVLKAAPSASSRTSLANPKDLPLPLAHRYPTVISFSCGRCLLWQRKRM